MISWIAAVFSLTGIYLNARKDVLCWPIWICSNILWAGYYLYPLQPAPLFLVCVFFFGNIYGWRKWSKP
jgi:nicotinamide riboside transporter PnuC